MLRHWRLIRYEDLAASPNDVLKEVWALAELPPHRIDVAQFSDHNPRYLSVLTEGPTDEDMLPTNAERLIIERFGYSLEPPFTSDSFQSIGLNG